MIDHWRWVVMGLQGLVGFMNQLESAQVPTTPEAARDFERFMAELNEHLRKQKERHERKS